MAEKKTPRGRRAVLGGSNRIGLTIRRYRQAAGMEQKQLSALLGYTANAVTNWEAGRSRPDICVIPQLCGILDMPVYDLLGMTGEDASTREEKDLLNRFRGLTDGNRTLVRQMMDLLREQQDTTRLTVLRGAYSPVPVAEEAAAAGVGAPMDGESGYSEVYVHKNALREKCDFIVRVNGESMEPLFADGSMVYVQRTQELSYGDIGLFVVNGESYIKQYRAEGLLSLNPAFPLIPISDGSSVLVVGRVIGAVREEDIPSQAEQRMIRKAWDMAD